MTEDELKQTITKLESALQTFEGVEFAEKQTEVESLKDKLASMVFDGVIEKFESIPEFEINAFRQKVKDAVDATKERQAQVDAFNTAMVFIKRLLGV